MNHLSHKHLIVSKWCGIVACQATVVHVYVVTLTKGQVSSYKAMI